jgi:hypothetical protein
MPVAVVALLDVSAWRRIGVASEETKCGAGLRPRGVASPTCEALACPPLVIRVVSRRGSCEVVGAALRLPPHSQVQHR